MLYFLQQCLNAVQVSCFYALLAAAYVLVHGIADRINLSFGGIAMWGAYLTIGAKICGAPALDRQFGTIDFLTLLDLEAMPAGARERFLG